jgi:hypothetical protein
MNDPEAALADLLPNAVRCLVHLQPMALRTHGRWPGGHNSLLLLRRHEGPKKK